MKKKKKKKKKKSRITYKILVPHDIFNVFREFHKTNRQEVLPSIRQTDRQTEVKHNLLGEDNNKINNRKK